MNVAVIGAGVMGSAIARRLIHTGATVWVFDADRAKAAELIADGGQICESAAEAAVAADLIILSLPNARIVEAVIFGSKGVAEASNAAKLVFDMSSIDAKRTAELASRLLTQTGAGWVDAPLSGGAPAASSGTLTLMLGGRNEDIERAKPLLAALAGNYTHFGPAGAGQTVKSINQILCASYFMAVAEAVRFAEDNGVDATLIPAALAGGRADSRILQEFMAKMAKRDFTPTGRIDNMLKDLNTVGDASTTRLPITERITQIHCELVEAGFGDKDSAEYIRMFDVIDRK